MATFHFTVTTPKPASDVFAYLADMTNAKTWDPSISSVLRLDKGGVALGSSFQVTLGFLGRDLVLTYHVVAFEPSAMVVLRSETGLFVSEDTITVSSLKDGTTVLEYEARLFGKGVASVLDPLFKLSINHFGRQAGAKLRSGYLR